MGKIETVKKVAKSVAGATSATVDKATSKESNNLLLIILIVIVWLYLFFTK